MVNSPELGRMLRPPLPAGLPAMSVSFITRCGIRVLVREPLSAISPWFPTMTIARRQDLIPLRRDNVHRATRRRHQAERCD